jgi:hypothetical protein
MFGKVHTQRTSFVYAEQSTGSPSRLSRGYHEQCTGYPNMPLGYGRRIEQAILLYSSVHGRTSLDVWGKLVAEAEGRAKPYGKSTVVGWINEDSEPELSVFYAMAAVAGGDPSWYAFGNGEGPGNPAAETTTPAQRGAGRGKGRGGGGKA